MKCKRHKISIDLSEWELGDWPDRVNKLITVEKTSDHFSLELDTSGLGFEELTRQIAKEAIEEFLHSGNEGFCPVRINRDGILFIDGDQELAVIPWEDISLEHPNAANALREWLDSELNAWPTTEGGTAIE